MTNSTPLLQFNHSSDRYRNSRRRWVPKGVMLLILLFAVGLLSACQSAVNDAALAEIAVPVTQSTALRCPANKFIGDPAYSVVSYQKAEWSGRIERSNLKTF